MVGVACCLDFVGEVEGLEGIGFVEGAVGSDVLLDVGIVVYGWREGEGIIGAVDGDDVVVVGFEGGVLGRIFVDVF